MFGFLADYSRSGGIARAGQLDAILIDAPAILASTFVAALHPLEFTALAATWYAHRCGQSATQRLQRLGATRFCTSQMLASGQVAWRERVDIHSCYSTTAQVTRQRVYLTINYSTLGTIRGCSSDTLKGYKFLIHYSANCLNTNQSHIPHSFPSLTGYNILKKQTNCRKTQQRRQFHFCSNVSRSI